MLEVRLVRDEEPTDPPRDKRTNVVVIYQYERKNNTILWAEGEITGCKFS